MTHNACPAGHDHDELKRNATAWAALPLVGYMPSYADPGEPPVLALKNCPGCNSTLGVPCTPACDGCGQQPATRRCAFDVADVCDYCGEMSDRQHAEMVRRDKWLAMTERT